MAGESIQITLGSNARAFMQTLASDLTQIESMLGRSASETDRLDFGAGILERFRAHMAQVMEMSRNTQAQLAADAKNSITSASKTAPYQKPAGGSYAQQDYAGSQSAINLARDTTAAYVAKWPQLRNELEREGASGIQQILTARRQIRDNDLNQLKAVRDEQVRAGVNIPASAVSRGSQDARINQLAANAFPAAARPLVATTSEVAQKQADDALLAEVRQRNAARERAAGLGTASEQLEKERQESLIGEIRQRNAARARAEGLGTASEQLEKERDAELLAEIRDRKARRSAAGGGGGRPPVPPVAPAPGEDPNELPRISREQVIADNEAYARRKVAQASESGGKAETRAQQNDAEYQRERLAMLHRGELGEVTRLSPTTFATSQGGYYGLTQKGQGISDLSGDRLVRAQAKQAELVDKQNLENAEILKLLELRHQVLSGEATQLGKSATSPIAVSRDEIYGINTKGTRATQLSGAPLIAQQTRFDRQQEETAAAAARQADLAERRAEAEAARQQRLAERQARADTTTSNAKERQAKTAEQEALVEEETLKLLELRAMVARKEAIQLGTSANSPIAVSRDEIYGVNNKGTQATQLTGAPLMAQQGRYDRQLEAEADRVQRDGMAREGLLNRALQAQNNVIRSDEELANAQYVLANTIRKAGNLYETPNGIYRQSSGGATKLSNPLEIAAAQSTFKRQEPTSFFGGVARGLTSRSAYANGGNGPAIGSDEFLKAIPGNIGTRLGTMTESVAGFAAMGATFKAISDTKKETLDYIDSLTNLEVRMKRSGAVTAGFTNQLEGLSRLAGSNVGAELDAAARSVSAFGDASRNTTEELRAIGEEGAAASSQLAVISGTDLPTASNNLVAVASSFGLASDSLGQVTDAVANAKMLGGESKEITSGLASVAGAAQEAGYNSQQAADMISLITARTNESGQAAATRLAAIFQLFGSHQDVLKNLGIDTSGTVKSQIEALAQAFPGLTAAQQKLTLSQLGGRTALRELLPLLNEQPRLAKAYSDSLDHAGAGTDEFNRKNADLAGLFRKLGGDITNIQLNLERSGAFNDIGLALKALEPGLRTLSDLLGLFDRAVTMMGPLSGLPGILLDTYLALKLIDSLGRLPLILSAIPGLGKTRALPTVVTNRVPALAQKGANAGAAGADAGAEGADTAATNANTAAKNANALASAKQAQAETFVVRSAREATEATRAHELALIAAADAAEVEKLALADLAGVEDLEAKISGEVAAATTREADAIAFLAEARANQLEATTGLTGAENLLAESVERSTLAQAASAKAAALNAAALELEAKAATMAGERSSFGLGVGARVTGARAAAARKGATAAAGAAETEAGATGLLAGGGSMLGTLSVVAGVAIAGDMLFQGIKHASDATKKSLDDTASAMTAVGAALSPTEISSAADQLRAAAAERDKSTSGIIGSTKGFLTKYLGSGADSNADAQNLRDASKMADARAKALQDVQTQQAQLGNPAVFQGAPESIDAVKSGFQAMTTAGRSAAHQIDALITALNGLPGQGAGPGHILPGGSADLGAKLSKNLQETAITSLRTQINEKSDFSPEINAKAATDLITKGRIPHGPEQYAIEDYYGNGDLVGGDKNNINFADPTKFQEIQKKTGDIVTKYIKQAGLDNGGVITDAMATDLAGQIADLYVDPKATKAQQKRMHDEAQKHIKAQILNNTNPANLVVNQTTADQISALLTAQAQTAGQDTLATGGDQLAAAQTTYNAILATNAMVVKKGRMLSDAQNQATIVAYRAVADAYIARADASDAFSKDLLPLDDAVGRAAQDYVTALRHVQEAVGRGDFLGMLKAKAEEVDTKRVLDQANLDVANAHITDSVPQDNGSATADAALKVARNNLKPLDVGSAKYKDQLKVIADAEHTAMLSHINDAYSVAEAAINPNNNAAMLAQKATEAANTYRRLATDGKAGAKEVHDAFMQMNAAADAVLTNALADTNAEVTDAVDPRNLVGVANAAVTTTANTVKSDQARGVTGKPLKDDQAAQRNAGIDALTTGIADTNLGADAAVTVGDSYAEAYNAYLDLVRTAAGQIGNTRLNTLRQAEVQRVAAEKLAVDLRHGGNVARIDPRNSIALAQEALANDNRALAVGGQSTQDRLAEEQQKAQDELNVVQLTTARNNSRRAALSRQGDPTAAALVQLRGASAILRNDLKGTDQYYQDLATVRGDQLAYAQALREHAKNLALLAGDTTDPVEQARVALQEATSKLATDRRKKTGDLAQDRLDKETSAASLQKAQFDQTMSTQQTMYQLHEISTQTYLGGLQLQDRALRKQLAGMHKGQQNYQQFVDELNTVDQAIQGLNDQLQGQFNLGDIKLPTIYEVRRSAAQGGVAATSSAVNAATVNNAVTINGADFAAVVSYINSILGRTSTTVATTGRKAAA